MKSHIPCFLAAGLLSLAACDDDERDPPPYRSGVSSEGKVSELNEEQKHQICETYGTHVDAHVDLNEIARAVCLPASLLAGVTEETCEAFLSDCTENFIVTGSFNARVHDEAACVASLDSCDTSVVDLEGCVNLNLNLVYDVLERLSCRRFNDQEAQAEARERQQAASVCSQKDMTCGQIAEYPLL